MEKGRKEAKDRPELVDRIVEALGSNPHGHTKQLIGKTYNIVGCSFKLFWPSAVTSTTCRPLRLLVVDPFALPEAHAGPYSGFNLL